MGLTTLPIRVGGIYGYIATIVSITNNTETSSSSVESPHINTSILMVLSSILIFLTVTLMVINLWAARKRGISPSMGAWLQTFLLWFIGSILLFWGSYMETSKQAAGGVVIVAGGACLIGWASIQATVASKYQQSEEKDK